MGTHYSTNVTYLSLEGHVELQKYRYFYFIITLILYLLIICFNTVVISVICRNKHLHEPMYIFIAALLCNALFGATALNPKLLIDFLSETQVVSFDGCTFQAFFIYTYGMSEFTLLSAMAYDRYVSICKPLQYSTIIQISTVKKILFFCWFVPFCETGVGIVLTYQLKFCNFKLRRIYCDNYSVVKLSCGDITANNIYGLFVLCIAVLPPVIFIIFSYVKILSVCLGNSKDFRRKALQTCFPHIVIFICYCVTSCFEVISSRLGANVPHIIAMIMSVQSILTPPLINPIIYGLKLQEIRNRVKNIICKRKTHAMF